MKLEESESVKRWLNAVHADHAGSDFTRDSYLRWFKRFVDWVEKTPDQPIEERKQQLKSEDEETKRKAEETLRDFCNHLEKEGAKRGTVLSYHSAVKSFYKYNYLPLALRTPKKHAAEGVKPHTRRG